MSSGNVVPAADTIGKRQPRLAANACCFSGVSGDDTTKAARLRKWSNTPLKPSAQSVQDGQDVPILCTTKRVSLSPNSSDSWAVARAGRVNVYSFISPG